MSPNVAKVIARYIAKNTVLKKLQKWDEEKTAIELAKICGFNNHMAIYKFAHTYGLQFKDRRRQRKTPWGRIRTEGDRVKKLKEMGFTLQEIGQLYGVGKERARQILKMENSTKLLTKI